MNYPFPCDPGKVPYDTNETGCHVRSFSVPKDFKGHQLRLRFEGVDSAFHVWVNGHEVGYSQGSRNPSEFDITEFVNEGQENRLAVQVYQYSDGSYIEDQVSFMTFLHVYMHSTDGVRTNGGSVVYSVTSICLHSQKSIYRTSKYKHT